ncbi:VCBS repeat-containing protein [Planctomycetales bacterium ZRK34]|nr:VCBS repeat-containing protein [Planctomycetales bacterium ZRK34]
MHRPPARLMMIVMLAVCAAGYAESPSPWARHVIDDSSRGADGVRLGDVNGDGLMDIVTGWEEGGVVRVYVNPGPQLAKQKWPAVSVGRAKNVEDAVFVDLDNDGALDVVSSCEGKTRTMYVHWAPRDPGKLLDESSWTTEAIPATADKQLWMYCLPMQVDGEHGIDLVVGSKKNHAAVGWLQSPDNPRDLAAWRYHRVADAGWIMSLDSTRFDDAPGVLVTDRKGSTRGVYLLQPPTWRRTDIELDQAEYLFGTVVDQRVAVATRDGYLRIYQPDPWRLTSTIPNPFGVTWGKAVAIGRINDDRSADYVTTANIQKTPGKSAVAWIDGETGAVHDISGPQGIKFDRVELIDLDADGDLDVLTCEERANLGVIWYENPTR